MIQDNTTKPNHYKDLLRLGTPIVIGQIGQIVLNLADTLMIGHHNTEELAAAPAELARKGSRNSAGIKVKVRFIYF